MIKQTVQKLGDYVIISKLGHGLTSEVVLGGKGNKLYALKIARTDDRQRIQSNINTIKKECQVLLSLNHENIINLVDNITYDEEAKEYFCVFEYAAGGEFYDFVEANNGFGSTDENIARTYFLQMLSAIDYVHSNNFAHRDLKPENILLGSSVGLLKIADFGFAQCMNKYGNNKLKTHCGTKVYMAPEILNGKDGQLSYSGDKVDVFSLGVILFLTYAWSFPFSDATQRDGYYQFIYNNKPDKFWQCHARHYPSNFFSKEFCDLVSKMFQVDPNKRISISEIKNHPWVKKKNPYTKEQIEQFPGFQDKNKEIQLEMSKKLSTFKRIINEKQNDAETRSIVKIIEENYLKMDFSEQSQNVIIENFNKNNFYSHAKPAAISNFFNNKIGVHFDQKNIQNNENQNEISIQLMKNSENVDLAEQFHEVEDIFKLKGVGVDMQIQISVQQKEISCCNFFRNSGDILTFKKFVQAIKSLLQKEFIEQLTK